MFKRLMFGLFAVGLVAVFTVETANSAVGRYRRSVENLHKCETSTDPCYGAESVTDTLYGWDGTNAICNMTGRVFCDPLDNGEICSDADSNTKLTSASFSNTATFLVDTASDLTVLDDATGQQVCDAEYPPETTVFNKFWPNAFLAYSTYKFPTSFGKPDYELIEKCFIQTDDPEYSCTKLWDSTYQSLPPHLPCCGETNTLTVEIADGVGGTVTSENNEINCGTGGTDCEEVFDGTMEPIDACPEVKLTARPDPGYVFTGWSENCSISSTGECIITPDADVTATFALPEGTLTVIVTGGVAGAKVWIKDPRENFDDPDEFYCTDICTKEVSPGDLIVLKRKGGTYLNWGGICEGVPNANDTCAITMPTDGSGVLAISNFAP